MLKKIAISLMFICGSVNAASFDCSKAYSKVEKLICNTPSLSKADDELYVDYLQAKLVTGNSDEFKKIAKLNWKLREKNCETEQCLLAWYKKSTDLYRNLASSKNNINDNQKCYKEGQQIVLSGVLKREVSPGPPNYESISHGDTPEIYWVLNSDNKLCANGSPDWGDKNQLQLILSDALYKQNEKYLNQSVSVSGSLVYAVTGHHHTPVMIDVESINVEKVERETPKISSANNKKTIGDFINENEEFNKFSIKRAITDRATAIAFGDTLNTDGNILENYSKSHDLIKKNGYEYARLAVIQLSTLCNMDASLALTLDGLSSKDCEIIKTFKE